MISISSSILPNSSLQVHKEIETGNDIELSPGPWFPSHPEQQQSGCLTLSIIRNVVFSEMLSYDPQGHRTYPST